MSIYTRARAEDVRALAGAIVLGSSMGLALGGASLLGGPGHPAAQTAQAPAAGAQASTSPALPLPALASATKAPPAAGPGARPGIQGLAQALRDRFRLGAPAGPSAAPFAFARVAEAPTDLHCLAETVYFEARGESVDGQEAVAQVVLNRVRHPAFPKTICGVVHQRTAAGCQFAFACAARDVPTGGVAWRRAQTVASAALHGAVMATVGDATHFQTARSGPFAGLLKVAQIGAHVFYRFAGHGGAEAMFHQAPAPSAEPSAAPARVELARLDPPAGGVGHPSAVTVPSAVQVAATAPKAPVVQVRLAAAAPDADPAAGSRLAAARPAAPVVTRTQPAALQKPVVAPPAPSSLPTLALAQS